MTKRSAKTTKATRKPAASRGGRGGKKTTAAKGSTSA